MIQFFYALFFILIFFFVLYDFLFSLIGFDGYRSFIRYLLFFIIMLLNFRYVYSSKLFLSILRNRIVVGVVLLFATLAANSFLIWDESQQIRLDFFTDFIIYAFLPFFVILMILNKKGRIVKIPFAFVFFAMFYYFVLSQIMDLNQIVLDDRRIFREYGLDTINISRLAAIIFLVSLFYISYSKDWYKRVFLFLIIIISMITLLLTKQRGTIIGIAIATINLIWFISSLKYKFRIYASFLLIFGLFASNFIDIYQFGVLERFENLREYQTFERFQDYYSTWEIFSSRLFFGAGTEGYYLITGRTYPHNMFLELIANFGLIGLLISYLLFSKGFQISYRVLKNQLLPVELKLIICIWILVFISIMISGNIITNSIFFYVSAFLVLIEVQYLNNIESDNITIHE